jgi:DNA topoisomerase-3
VFPFPETIYKLEMSEDTCEQCECPLLSIDYHKEKTPLPNGATKSLACLFCDKYMKVSIDNYLKAANIRAEFGNRGGRGGRRGGGGGRGRGRGGRGRGRGRGRGGVSARDW